jgi:outer membrane receptor for ferrienterochelin and colicins
VTEDRNWKASVKLTRGITDNHFVAIGTDLETVSNVNNKSLSSIHLDAQTTTANYNLENKLVKGAVYLQDEFVFNENISGYIGGRLDTAKISTNAAQNRHVQFSPLFHLLWKPQKIEREQVRMSVTRSYKFPTTAQLNSFPIFATARRLNEGNDPTNPDLVSNPNLGPESSLGMELSYEAYFSKNGMTSLNLFSRAIRDVILQKSSLESTAWSNVNRWVSTPVNGGKAKIFGAEFETKALLNELWKGLPPVEIRGSISYYKSEIRSVPPPNNRLQSQPRIIAKLSGNYRFPQQQATIGGGIGWTPAYEVRRSENEYIAIAKKIVGDAYVTFRVAPKSVLRVRVSNYSVFDDLERRTYVSNALTVLAQESKRMPAMLSMRLEHKF